MYCSYLLKTMSKIWLYVSCKKMYIKKYKYKTVRLRHTLSLEEELKVFIQQLIRSNYINKSACDINQLTLNKHLLYKQIYLCSLLSLVVRWIPLIFEHNLEKNHIQMVFVFSHNTCSCRACVSVNSSCSSRLSNSFMLSSSSSSPWNCL
jgi:hypothetical protein